MPDLQGLKLAVIGGGALGLTVGVQASRHGAQTTLYAPATTLDSASGVAAGMLAPAFEAALDPVSADHFDLMREARDAWPEMMVALDLPDAVLDRSGALQVGAADEAVALEVLEMRLRTMGAACERLDSVALSRLHPDLSPALVSAVFTPEDWRIDPKALLHALEAVLTRMGARRSVASVSLDSLGRFVAEGAVIAADAVIVAAGPGALAWRGAIPELAALYPIKGQILHFDTVPCAGPVVRWMGGYVAPQLGGAIVGATMDVGRADLAPDPIAVERLRSGAAHLFAKLAQGSFQALVGVRVATADGLPLVGASRRPDTYLAVGARRNGWLLAPMIADMLVCELAGRPPHGARELLAADRAIPSRRGPSL